MPNYKSSLITVMIDGEITFLDFRYFTDGTFALVRDGFHQIMALDALTK